MPNRVAIDLDESDGDRGRVSILFLMSLNAENTYAAVIFTLPFDVVAVLCGTNIHVVRVRYTRDA